MNNLCSNPADLFDLNKNKSGAFAPQLFIIHHSLLTIQGFTLRKEYKMDNLIVSYAPHIRSARSTKKLMADVVIALIPALIAGIVFFGLPALVHTLVCVASCMFFEFIWEKIFKLPITVFDFSAIITGMLLAFNLPVSAPYWIGVVGSAFAIIIVKMFFGGLGNNFVNPALAGRAFLLACWPVIMTKWTSPKFNLSLTTDAVSTATPLGALKESGEVIASYSDLFFGNIGGCIGEVSAFAILIGLAYLLVRKVITWRVPVIYIGVVFVLTELLGQDGLYFILSGGLMLGAVFMATDYVTSPMSGTGLIIYAIGLGVLTVVIRIFGKLPEGVTYSILIMNIVTPLIDRYFKNRIYGGIKNEK